MQEKIPLYSDSLIDNKLKLLAQVPWLHEDVVSQFMDVDEMTSVLKLV